MSFSDPFKDLPFDIPYNPFKAQNPSTKSWLWTSMAYLSSGMLIKYVGYPRNRYRNNNRIIFFKTLYYCQIGFAITAVSTYLLQYTSFPIVAEDNQTLVLITSIVGILKFRLPMFSLQRNQERRIRTSLADYFGNKYSHWVCLCAVPSLFFCSYKKDIQGWALQYTILAGLAGTTAGAILPSYRFKDVGLVMSAVGVGSILSGLVYYILTEDELLMYPKIQPIDFGATMMFLGFLVDDTIAVKGRADRIKRTDRIKFNPLSLSLPLYFDLIFIYTILCRLIDTNQISTY